MRRVHALVVGLLALTGCAKMKADRFCDVAVENGPYADFLEYLIVKDNEAAMLKFEAGEISYTDGIAAAQFSGLKVDLAYKCQTLGTLVQGLTGIVVVYLLRVVLL